MVLLPAKVIIQPYLEAQFMPIHTVDTATSIVYKINAFNPKTTLSHCFN